MPCWCYCLALRIMWQHLAFPKKPRKIRPKSWSLPIAGPSSATVCTHKSALLLTSSFVSVHTPSPGPMSMPSSVPILISSVTTISVLEIPTKMWEGREELCQGLPLEAVVELCFMFLYKSFVFVQRCFTCVNIKLIFKNPGSYLQKEK